MIRPCASALLPAAKLPAATQRASRRISDGPARRAQGDAPWPLLTTRTRARHHGGAGSLGVAFAPPEASLAQRTTGQGRLPATEADSRLMLILHGLSPNLNPSDFYRLAPDDLSSWRSVINKVQQQRNPATLEPLGRYHISFATASAAASYRDRFLRLHRLSRLKLRSPNGLWESSVPPFLKSSGGEAPAAELDTFTLVPGSQPTVDVDRRRVSARNGWARALGDVVHRFGCGERPPVVLLHVYPPTLTAEHVFRFIREDGVARGCRWDVCPPHHLEPKTRAAEDTVHGGDDVTAAQRPSSEHKDSDTTEKRRSRFVVVCATEAEARRFHRHWNQRTLTAGPEGGATRNIVHASIINW
ncbi:Uncharacterized protein TCAP_05138 [Tolypocladium capitatum]|uniref:Uncharacterized protein n=1 Tax=Tolypocladium capitatum TaxID=45235 RepID=A0A2K3QBP9_9HYPO|nr:Uncharacterized protein TCAP_05138 [Tolypocladium capitatum]